MAKSVYIEMSADPIQPRDIILLRRASKLGEVSVKLVSDAALASAKRVSVTAYYLPNPDIVDQGWPALVHYEAFGKFERRAIS